MDKWVEVVKNSSVNSFSVFSSCTFSSDLGPFFIKKQVEQFNTNNTEGFNFSILFSIDVI